MTAIENLRPLHHTTCDHPITGAPGLTSIRVVMTDRGILQSLVDYFLAPQHRGKSPSWRRSVARSVGYFYDFNIQARHLYETKVAPITLLSDFSYHLVAGTIDADGHDDLGLYWPKQPFRTVDQYVKNLSAFSDYCVKKHGAKAANPWRKSLSFSEQLARFRAWDKANDQSLLHHTGSRKQAWNEASQVRSFSLRGTPKIDQGDIIAFPDERFDELIYKGFARPGRSGRNSLAQTIQIRDAMIAVLQRGAGFRESEPFHLYVDDVWENPTNPGSALVRIHHPTDGKVETFDPISGRNVLMSRGNYLNTIGYAPRNLLRGKERAGWKDPLLIKDRPTKTVYMEAYWFPQTYGEIFWQLYKTYMTVRPKTAHPFLLVTDRGENAGEPYNISQYNKKLKRAVERIGLSFGKEFGTTSHGLRHRYGEDIRLKAGFALPVRQKLMHHKNPRSTERYGEPLGREIHDQLSAAQEKLTTGNYLTLEGYQ